MLTCRAAAFWLVLTIALFQSATEAYPGEPLRAKFLLYELGDQATNNALAFSPSGKCLASAGGEKRDRKYEVFFWELAKKEITRRAKTNLEFFIISLDYAPDEKTILAADYLGNVTILDVKDLATVDSFKLFELFRNNIMDVKHTDCQNVLTLAKESVASIRSFHKKDSKLYNLFCERLSFGTIANTRSACAFADGASIFVWEKMTTKNPGIVRISKADEHHRFGALSDDISRLLCANYDATMTIYDVAS